MESFKSSPHAIACSAATIYSKLTNPSLIKNLIDEHADKIEGEARQHLDTVKFSEGSISIQSPMGEVSLSLDREQSIEGQVRDAQSYAERQGYHIVNIYADRAISGTTDQRPAFQKMI